MDDLPVTVYIIADFDSSEGLELAKEALKFLVCMFHLVFVGRVHLALLA